MPILLYNDPPEGKCLAEIISEMWRYEQARTARELTMPPVEKLTPRPNTTRPGVKQPVPEDENGDDLAWGKGDTLQVLAYGQSGSGKTTFASTFPAPILWLVCSGSKRPGELKSIDTAENRKRITPKIVRNTSEIKGYLALAASGSFKSVVWDHVSGLQDLTIKEILGIEELPAQKGWGLAQQQQWGQSTAQCKEFLRTTLGLPCNVVLLAQERTFGGNEDGLSDIIKPMVGPSVTPSLAGWLMPACDYVVQTYKRPRVIETKVKVGDQETTVTERGKGADFCIRTEIHDCYATKVRIPRGRTLPDFIADPSHAKLVKVIRGG